MYFMGIQLNWRMKANMVNGLLFYTTVTSRRWRHTPLMQAGAETFNTGAEALNLIHAVLGREISRGWVSVSE